MQIGYVEKKELAVQNSEGEVIKKSYYEMSIRAIFGGVEKFTLSKNNSDNTNAPAFNIYAHNQKNWGSRKLKVGALWLKTTDDGTSFMAGHIETPLVYGGKIQISLWRAKPLYEREEVTWEYDVVWKPYAPQTNTEQRDIPVSIVMPEDIDTDEIPF